MVVVPGLSIKSGSSRWLRLIAIVSFAGAGQRRRLFRGLDILTIKCATETLAGRVSLPPQYTIDVEGPDLRRGSTMTSDPHP